MSKFILRTLSIAIILAFVAVVSAPLMDAGEVAYAQDGGIGLTPEPEDTPVTNQPVDPAPAPSDPAQIPEPVTVILFGSGLAALSASVAKKRKKQ